MALSPNVSIVIPAYQAEDTIERAIKSVLRQTLQELEVLVVDNASSDGTRQKVLQLANQDSRVIYVPVSKNLGPAGGRNVGIGQSKSPLIAFLDADDEWIDNTKLVRQVNILKQHSSVGMIFTDCDTYDEITKQKRLYSSFNNISSRGINFIPLAASQNFQVLKGDVARSLYGGNFICISTVLVRKELLSKINFFNPDLLGTEDIDLWVRLSKVCEFCYWDNVTIRYFWQENSISRINEKRIGELIKYHLYCKESPFYSDMRDIAFRNLEHNYKLQILDYSRRWQLLKSIRSFFSAKEHGIKSPKLFFYMLTSFLGPIPLFIKLNIINRVKAKLT